MIGGSHVANREATNSTRRTREPGSTGQARLIEIMRNQPGQTQKHYAAARGVSRERIRQLLQTLHHRGLTEQGPDGKWRVTEERTDTCETCGQTFTTPFTRTVQCDPCLRNLGEWPTLNNGEQP